MSNQISPENAQFVPRALNAFDGENGGIHPGFRPAHAKGVLLTGVFVPAEEGAQLTRAPHLHRESTPVTVRFSDATGIPTIGDGDAAASPRGCAVRFHLAEHSHTDIVAHSVDAFPARTGDDFVELMEAVVASGPDVPEPKPIQTFLGKHPETLRFLQAPKPTPTSFAKLPYFAVSAFVFHNAANEARFGRYRIRPEGEAEYLSDSNIAKDMLMDEIKARVARSPIKLHIRVQLAQPDDVTDDVTVRWPEDREEIAFGTLELTGLVADDAGEQQHIIFDPIPRVDGIEPSADPLFQKRADLYLASGRRRRASGAQAASAR